MIPYGHRGSRGPGMDGYMDGYEVTVAGVHRVLPVVEVAPGVRIAAFVLLGDVELVEACAGALAARLAPAMREAGAADGWAVVGPEAKAVPLLHRLAERLGHARYVVCRKGVKGYMRQPLEVPVCSITTPGQQRLVLDGPDAEWLHGRDVALVDDVVSTGGTLRAVESLMWRCGARVRARAAVWLEGDGPQPPGVLALGRLPVWREEQRGPTT